VYGARRYHLSPLPQPVSPRVGDFAGQNVAVLVPRLLPPLASPRARMLSTTQSALNPQARGRLYRYIRTFLLLVRTPRRYRCKPAKKLQLSFIWAQGARAGDPLFQVPLWSCVIEAASRTQGPRWDEGGSVQFSSDVQASGAMQSSHLWRLTVGSPSFTSVHTGRVVHLILESLVGFFSVLRKT